MLQHPTLGKFHIFCRRTCETHPLYSAVSIGPYRISNSCFTRLAVIEGAKPPSSASEASREGIQRPHESFAWFPPRLLPLREGVVRCSPRFRRCSSVVRKSSIFVITKDEVFRTTTRSAHRWLWLSVHPVGVGHSEPPVKGSRLRSLESLCPRRMQAPTQKQEAPPSTSEGRVAPSAVGWGSSLAAIARG